MSESRIAEESGRGAWQVFMQDLARALHVWRTTPFLPLCTVILLSFPVVVLRLGFWSLISLISLGLWALELVAVLLIILFLFSAGWVGTERVWYLRAYRGKAMRPGELWRLTWAFFGRYARLGFRALLPVFLVVSILWLVVGQIVGQRVTEELAAFKPMGPADLSSGVQIDKERAVEIVKERAAKSAEVLEKLRGLMYFAAAVAFVLWALVDVVLTFVTPALAFTTRHVGQAFSIGWRMLRDEWPYSAGYALVPPLGLLLAIQSLPETILGTVGDLVLSLAATLLNLWFKGATAAFYLRRYDTGDDGAAFGPPVSK